MSEILKSEWFWAAVGFAINTASTLLVARLPASGPWRQAVRALHGLLNKVDPEGNQEAKP